MNTILSSQSRGDAKMVKDVSSDRRAKTRMTIQLGGLVKLSGLSTICDIGEVEDLQFDITSRDKAAVLLGILLETVANIEGRINSDQMESWQKTGERLLKQRAAQIAYHRAQK